MTLRDSDGKRIIKRKMLTLHHFLNKLTMKFITKFFALAALLLGIMSCSKGDVLNGTTWKCTTSGTALGVTVTTVETFTFATPNFTYSVSGAANTSSIGINGKDNSTTGTYTVDGNKVTMIAKDSDGKEHTYTATVDKTILVFEGRTFEKQK